MKAEHKKELQTNALADWIGRSLQSGKQASKNTYIVGGLVALAVAGLLVYFYLQKQADKAASDRWYNLDKASSVDELEKLAAANHGTYPALAARFEAARALLARGVQDLANQPQHESALDSLLKARTLYQELAPQAKGLLVYERQALYGLASAEESLVGTGKDATLDKALEYYQAVADRFPDTPEGTAAKKRADELRDPKNRAEIEKWYIQLNQRIAKGN